MQFIRISILAIACLVGTPVLAADESKPYPLKKCFLSGRELGSDTVSFVYEGQQLKVCCKDCKAEFDKNPAQGLEKLSNAMRGYRNIQVNEFETLRKAKGHVVLDVRTKKEFDAGHIPGAINIDVTAPDFSEQVAKLDKSKTYLVHCRSGGRSLTACKKLAPAGFETLFNLEGGYAAWEKAGHTGVK